jgi:hypothetical protein
MSDQLFRLGTTQWWVLVDVQNERIVDQFNKPQLAATIQGLEAAIAAQPSFSDMQQDYADLIALVKAQNIPNARKERVLALLGSMYASLEQTPIVADMLQMRERLSRLQSLYSQMEG